LSSRCARRLQQQELRRRSAGGADHARDASGLAGTRGSLQFYTPIIDLPPGSDTTWCTFTDTILAEDTLIHTTDGVQSPYGHHAILFYAPIPEQVGKTVECGAVDMDRFRQMMGGTGGEGANFWQPPANMATRLPKGAQLVVQTHWINTTNQTQQAQAHVAAMPKVQTPDTVIGGSVAIVNTSFSVDAHSKGTSTTTCTFDRDHHFVMFLPHEHEWGTHLTTKLLRTDGTSQMLLDGAYKPAFVSHPPIQQFEEATPLVIRSGDKVSVTCEWDNTTADPLQFPREMCVFFGYTLDDEGAHCTDGAWDHSSSGTGAGGASSTVPATSCVRPGDVGNSHGVGTPCTPAGGECKHQPQAGACLADLGQDQWMCTRIGCSVDADCGEAAVCHHDPAGSACVPAHCDSGSGGTGGAGGTAGAGGSGGAGGGLARREDRRMNRQGAGGARRGEGAAASADLPRKLIASKPSENSAQSLSGLALAFPASWRLIFTTVVGSTRPGVARTPSHLPVFL
jgi:hypothetical protein